MSAAPFWKVYGPTGEYQAACKEPEAAAALVGFYGAGATIRAGHRDVVWTEGKETQPACESYDDTATTIMLRLNQIRQAAADKRASRLRNVSPEVR